MVLEDMNSAGAGEEGKVIMTDRYTLVFVLAPRRTTSFIWVSSFSRVPLARALPSCYISYYHSL